eukprot:scaffold2886_cov137-Isochrysis_galbana.AAC.3
MTGQRRSNRRQSSNRVSVSAFVHVGCWSHCPYSASVYESTLTTCRGRRGWALEISSARLPRGAEARRGRSRRRARLCESSRESERAEWEKCFQSHPMTRPIFSLNVSFGDGAGTRGALPGMPLPSWFNSAKTSRLMPSGFWMESLGLRAGAIPGSCFPSPRMSRKSDMLQQLRRSVHTGEDG